MNQLLRIFPCLLLLTLASNAHAVLLGEDVRGQLIINGHVGVLDEVDTVVDPGIEYAFDAGTSDYFSDFFDGSLVIGATNNNDIDAHMGATLQWVFTLINPDLFFTSVTDTSNSYDTAPAFDGISNGGKTISFTISNQDIPASSTVFASYDLGVLEQAAVAAPTTLALLGLGLLGFASKRRV